jgi:hypothetical protein
MGYVGSNERFKRSAPLRLCGFGREQRAESKEQRAKSKEQRAKSKGQRAKSKEQRAESREQRAESKGQGARNAWNAWNKLFFNLWNLWQRPNLYSCLVPSNSWIKIFLLIFFTTKALKRTPCLPAGRQKEHQKEGFPETKFSAPSRLRV